MKNAALCLLLMAIIITSNVRVPSQVRYTGPIIDVHMHCYTEQDWKDNAMPNPVTNSPLTAKNAQEHFRETLREMKRFNIVKGMISNDDEYDVALAWQKAEPGRFLVGFGFADPAKVDLGFLRREIKAGRIQAIGEVDPQYLGIAPNDARLEPIFALAEELDIPVGFHIHPGPWGAVYKGSPLMRQSINSPLLLEDVIIKHPKLRLYVMHAGYPRIDEMINMLYAYPQLYVDIGVIDWTRPKAEFYEYLRRMVDAGFDDRIMFGSDQMVWTDSIAMAIANVRSAPFLTERQKKAIFYDNAARFFRIRK